MELHKESPVSGKFLEIPRFARNPVAFIRTAMIKKKHPNKNRENNQTIKQSKR